MSNNQPSSLEEISPLRNSTNGSRAMVAADRFAPTGHGTSHGNGNGHSDDSANAYHFDIEEEEWTMQRLLSLFYRRKAIILSVFAAVLFLSMLIAVLTPRVYQSTAMVYISSSKNKSNGAASDIPGLNNLLDSAGTRSQDTEIEIMQSQPVKAAALLLLPAELRRNRINRLDVKPVGQTDLVTVSTSSTNPTFAQRYTDSLCKAYVQQTQKESATNYGSTATFISNQLATYKGLMDRASDALKRYKQQNGITDLEADTAAHIESLRDVQKSLQQARVDLSAGTSQLQRLIATAATLPVAEVAPNTYTTRPIVSQLNQQLTTLQGQRDAALQEFTRDSPEVRTLDGQISRIRAQLKTEPKTEVSTSVRTTNPIRQALDEQIAQLRSQNAANSSRIVTLQQQAKQAQVALNFTPQREFRLNQLQMELQTYQQAYRTLTDRYLTTRISQNAPVGNARVQTQAEPAVQVKPSLRTSLIGGLFFGMLLAMGAALIVDRMDNRIHSEDDVRGATQLPILALIPRTAHFETESLVALATQHLNEQHTPLLESYRMLRTSLMFTVLDSPLRSIVLTSSQPNEGKSSVSANLATVLAMNGKRVLLIDGDLRRPSQHRIFGMSCEIGFTSVAAGLCSLEEAIQDTPVAGLRVLPTGPIAPNPPELLDSRAARSILQRAREMADFVIIDAPPALMMADAQILATEADGILLIVSWEEALKDAVARTSDLLARTGVKLIGVVVNKWDDRQAAYQSYYQNHYGPSPAALPAATETRKK